MTPTTVLRPVHAWFFFWERVVPSLYRVVATGLAATATAVALALVGADPLLALGVSVALWIGLAIGQEHDERVALPPDREFVTALTDAVSKAPLALKVELAHGPKRARPEAWDTFAVLSADRAPAHPLNGFHITVKRHAAHWMRIQVIDDDRQRLEDFTERLQSAGAQGLAERIQRSHSADDDAEAIRAALTTAYC